MQILIDPRKLEMSEVRSLDPRPGIYRIINKKTGDWYVGQTMSLYDRLAVHLSDLRKGRHDNFLLQDAWSRWTENMFFVTIIYVGGDEHIRVILSTRLPKDLKIELKVHCVRHSISVNNAVEEAIREKMGIGSNGLNDVKNDLIAVEKFFLKMRPTYNRRYDK